MTVEQEARLESCPKCGGTGSYSYDENHAKLCEACCTHDEGWWLLRTHYGESNGKYACKRGCGETRWPEEIGLETPKFVASLLASRPSPSGEMVERADWHSSEAERQFLAWNDGQTRTMADRRHAFHAGFAAALTTGSNRPSLGVEEATAEIERLRRNMRMIVSHATCGHSSDIDASVNDICVEISRSRNLVYQDGKSRAFEEAAKEVRRLGEEAAAEPYSCEIARAILALSQERSQS